MRDRLRDRWNAVFRSDGDSLLHPRYGWHTFERGLSWRKLRLFYGSSARRPRFWWLLVLLAPIAALHAVTVFLIGDRSLITFGAVVISVLVTYWCIRPFVRSGLQCWRASAIINDPPSQWVSTNTADSGRLWSPTRVIGDHLAVGAPIVAMDRASDPSQIYTKGRPGAYHQLGAHHWIPATDERILVHHLGPLLAAAQQKQIPIEHALANHVLHELAHWALEGENGAVEADHAPRWNRRLSAEIKYITNDGRASWDDTDHNRPPGVEASREPKPAASEWTSNTSATDPD